MSDNPEPPSIHTIPLGTTGGTPARLGFNLQDHVAATFCIRMMSEVSIKEVWNEAHDDVTLIWQAGQNEEVEFIQVKGHELEQLWSIARLCEQDSKSKTKSGTSIFERSLSRHCCSEPCRFRIVTARPVMDELKSLTLPLGCKERCDLQAGIDALIEKLSEKLKDARSPNGADGGFWVSRTVWEVVLGYLESKQLISVEKSGRAFLFTLTPQGLEVADTLRQKQPFEGLVREMKAVKKALGMRSGSSLKNLIYTLFEEEVAERELGEVIS